MATLKGIEKVCPLDCAFTAAAGKAVALLCGSWNCPTCARLLAREWAKIARYGLEHIPEQSYFWTLTMPGNMPTRARAFEVMPRQWDKLRNRLQYRVEHWLYIAFVEGQPQRGYMPHFHVLSSVKAYKRLKDLAVECGFGFQAKEVLIDSAGAEYYVSKYASKQGWDAPDKFRRVRASRTWPRPPKPDKDQYIVRAYSEMLYPFLERVAHSTSRDIAEIYEDYQITMGQPIDEETWVAATYRLSGLDEM